MNFNDFVKGELQAKHIDNDSNVENTPEWDSFNHVVLMVAIEMKYSIKLSNDEMVYCTSMEKIKHILSSHKQYI